MTGWQFTNLTNLGNGLMIAEGISLIVLLLLVFHLKRMLGKARNNNSSFWIPELLKQWSKESEILSRLLSNNLEERKTLANRLIEELDKKIQSLNLSLEAIEGKRKSIAGGGKEADPYGKVAKMVEAGYKFTEIARKLKLPKGEVQLILDLKQYSQSRVQTVP